MRQVHFPAGKLFGLVLIGCILAAIVALERAGIDVTKVSPARGSVTYTDRNGIVLGTILGSGSARVAAVPLDAISPAFLDAIVAAEDARFWHHGAVDVRALLRAAREYAIFGEARSGGSTIEMQLARLLFPIPGGFRGKLAQIWMAQRIEIASSKNQVLAAYVNRVPMGGNVYGVEAAARTYFGEPAAELDLAQATLLAAIPNDPAHAAPGLDWKSLRSRQRYVLQRMSDLGYITPASAQRAWHETLAVHRHESGIADAPHALFFLYRNGDAQGRVRTTLDRPLQRFVQAQTQDVIDALQRYHVTDAAALVADNRTGEILAYVGSPDYFSDAALGSNDGVQALRQPGSSLKPFTYELALERGTIGSTTILPDVPAAYAIPGGKLYQPADYSGRFSGPVRVRYALANSLNVPAVRVLSDLGVQNLLDRLRALGFTHLDRPASYYGLGLTLGSGEVSLWELVQAYVAAARDGNFIPLRLTGQSSPAQSVVGSVASWALVTDMLADPHARTRSFGSHSVLQMPFPAAVKTGTSSDFHDTWTVGFTRDYTVGVWVGNFDGSPMRGVSGVTGAGPLWNRIMLHLYERNAEPPPFPAPPGYVRATICATTGLAVTPATRGCPAAVQEWVRASNIGGLHAPEPIARLKIVFPRDGAVFALNPTQNALQVREQQLAFQAANANGIVRWRVDGASLAPDSNGGVFWPLHLGVWQIEASDGTRSDRVRIRVERAPSGRPGFTTTR